LGLQIVEAQPMTTSMAELSNRDVFQRIWDLYATGRTREILEYVHPDVEWRPALIGDVYRGHAGLARWHRDVSGAWKSITVVHEDVREVGGDCIVALGRVIAFGHGDGRSVDTQIAWVAEFRDGQVVRARGFLDRDAALAWVSERT
jgi:ketosteroid isomerase-like protein